MKFRIVFQAVKFCALGALLIPQSHADEWPIFRGPDQNGISKETNFKTEGDVKILWSVKVGLGHSAFTIADGLAYVTGHNGQSTGTIFCFDAMTGDEKWKYDYTNPLDPKYYAGGTTGAVTIHEGVAYHVARRGQISALDAKTGDVKWTKHLKDDFGFTAPTWGFTGAPVVKGDLLILAAGENGLVLDKKDGSELIKNGGGEAGYSTPYLFEKDGEQLAIVSHKKGYACIVPATGKQYWNHRWMTRYGVNAAEPIVSGDYVFISSGYGKGAVLLDWKGPGTGDPIKIWQSRDMKNQMNASVLVDGHLYGIDGNERQDGTGLKCLEMVTGETKWLEESVAHGAMSVAGGGTHLIVVTEQGELQIAPLTPEKYEPTLKAKVVPGKVWTVPVLANGIVYIRNEHGECVAVDLRK
ncbi:MAG: PQQ-binding-like beta-propeller repeat protein [Verrucomicrobiales bacterium]|nr:PQQ-binding-like beta-propeller repeat protein [Verrucomicrobiales bacterium]